MPKRSRTFGLPVPSAGQLIVLVAVVGCGWWVWQEYAGHRQRQSLWNPKASATDLIRSADAWRERGAKAVPDLTAALTDGSPQTRRYAALVLGQLRGEARSAIPALYNCLHDEHPFVRREAIGSLAAIDPESPDTAVAVAELLADPDVVVRTEAMAALREFGIAAHRLVKSKLRDPSPEARRLALELLADTGICNRAAALIAMELTNDPAPEVRRQAMHMALASQIAAVPHLARWLAEDDEKLTSSTISALDRLGDESRIAIPQLIACVERNGSSHAVQLLTRFGPDSRGAIPVLLKALDREASLIPALLTALLAAGYDPALLAGRCREYAGRPDGWTAAAAIRILKQSDPEGAREAVQRKIDDLRGDDVQRIEAACDVLRFLGGHYAERAIPELESLLDPELPQVRFAIQRLLIAMGPRAAPLVPRLAARLRPANLGPNDLDFLLSVIEAIGPAAAEAGPPILALIADPIVVRKDGYRLGPFERAHLLRTGARIGVVSLEFVDSLWAMPHAQSRAMKEAILESLAILGLGDERALAIFLQAMNSPESDVRLSAIVRVLQTVGPRDEVGNALIDLLNDPEPQIRALAAAKLASIPQLKTHAVEALRTSLSDPENGTEVYRASTALEGEYFPPIVKYIGNRSDRISTVADVMKEAIDILEAGASDPEP